MAYEKVQGTIEAINRTGKGFKLDDGEWYAVFKEPQMNGAQVGDSVRFDMQPNESGGKTFFNVKGDLGFLDDSTGRGDSSGASARGSREPAPRGRTAAAGRGTRDSGDSAPASGGRGSSSGASSTDTRQTSIIRQNSLTQANNLVGNSDALKADLQEMTGTEAAEFVIDIARVFEAYSQAND